ncbi:MAG: UDP-2,3-diacylglucosamine diphosphatase [Alphaproteobacteria bacterium]|nr:UDP-2,3-diacylglucosamine diphosphatase [Alphaproteobacteria bacterium]MBF0129341.1 UDP-2,3-diacylglucosamine diphosphatase [Alphaproteobacteria bacterium]
MNADGGFRIYRTIWISDVHLGTRGCKADLLLDFLRYADCETLYLVGDIVDGWRLRRGWYWPQSHNDVVQKLLRRGRKGTRVVYVPGNHDDFARDYAGNSFGAIEVVDEAVHRTADGRNLLILHGDAFDGVMRYARWLAIMGDHAYTWALALNHWFNLARRLFGYPYWSLSAYLKNKVKNAVQFVGDYERTVIEAARQRQVDGIICGHIHHAELREADGMVYANCGDWVESCTALVEHLDGRLEILYWADHLAAEEIFACAS